jgi:hypothetical protein
VAAVVALQVGEREEREGDVGVLADDDQVVVRIAVSGAVAGGVEVGHGLILSSP